MNEVSRLTRSVDPHEPLRRPHLISRVRGDWSRDHRENETLKLQSSPLIHG